MYIVSLKICMNVQVYVCVLLVGPVLSLCKYTKYPSNQLILKNVYVAHTVPVQLAPLTLGLCKASWRECMLKQSCSPHGWGEKE